MTKVLITGGTGLIGGALSRALLARGYEVTVLTRDPGRARREKPEGVDYAHWDIKHQQIDQQAIAAADHIIHLAGAGVAEKRWTDKRKKEILESRVQSAALLIRSLKEVPNRVNSFISSSAIGWYGPDPQIPNPRPFAESDKVDESFLGSTCRAWEESVDPAELLGKRLVKLRTGIVLGRGGGALEEFSKPLKFGVATILGSGNQVVSWIHIDDLVRLYIECLENEQMKGVYNAVAPGPVSNRELMLQLAKVVKGRFFVPVYVPSFVLKLMLGEMSIEVLKSATVSCEKLRGAGFTFVYPAIESALAELKG